MGRGRQSMQARCNKINVLSAISERECSLAS